VGTAVTGPEQLLAAVADALNACERAGLRIDNLKDGTVWTSAGYVLPFGDERLGARWVVRACTPTPLQAHGG
jgi:hypothetical protein